MRHWVCIFLFLLLAATGISQETRIVDSLQEVYATQEGREKVLTMIELTWDFYDVSFDDCIIWGEKAVKEANALGLYDLEAKANYVLGIQYAHHADLDLAKDYLRRSYALNEALADTANMFEALWSMATYELVLGSIDSSNMLYDNALTIAEQMNDSLSCVYIYANLAIINYQKNNFIAALDYYYQVVKISNDIGNHSMAIQATGNIATIYTEIGKPLEAKKILVGIIPELEAEEDYYLLQNTCKNLGSLYTHQMVNYDSAMYYFEKSMYYADCQVKKKIDQNLMRILKSEVLSEMAFISFNRGDHQAAVKGYSEALALAENESHFQGQMTACIGLGTVYSRLGDAKKSLQYLERFFELENLSGITNLHASVRLPLIVDYARLGRYDDLEAAIIDIDDERAALVREIADLYDRNRELEDVVAHLLEREEGQNAVLETQQTRMRQYKFVFFGCLAIVIAVFIGWWVWKWLKHYFELHAKSSK